MAAHYKMKILTDFAAAHYLRDYEGPCSRIHGHNWKVEVEVSASRLDSLGMGLDFKLIKQATNNLMDRLDHQNLNELPPFDRQNPTAENIAAWLYRELSGNLNTDVIRVASVTLWETERACVTYSEE